MTTLAVFRWCWRLLLVVGVALEVRALTNSVDGDTLSERVWWLLGAPIVGPLIRCMLGAFMLWLFVHFIGWGLIYWRGRELVVCLAVGLAVCLVWTTFDAVYA